MSIRISHSQVQQYNSCPRKWYFHRIERLRSPKVGSALFFGNALDDAFSRLLLEKKPGLTPEEEMGLKTKTPEEVFAGRMLETKNDAGQIVQIAQSPLADYYTSDFDAALFTSETVALVAQMDSAYNTLERIEAFHQYCKENLNPRNKARKRLADDEFILYNYISWLSLNEKGKLMLKAYQEDIFPLIHEVHAIQKDISIKSDMGDEICGKIDLIASFNEAPDVPYILDNKTASKPYSDDSVSTSEQLATYAEAEQNFNAGYLVVQKTVFKKPPFIRTQKIISTIPEKLLQLTFDNYANVCYDIAKAGTDIENYPQNTDSCFAFGKICAFYSICKHNNREYLIDCKKVESK